MNVLKDNVNITEPIILKVAQSLLSDNKDLSEDLDMLNTIIYVLSSAAYLKILPLVLEIKPELINEIVLLIKHITLFHKTIANNNLLLEHHKQFLPVEDQDPSGLTP